MRCPIDSPIQNLISATNASSRPLQRVARSGLQRQSRGQLGEIALFFDDLASEAETHFPCQAETLRDFSAAVDELISVNRDAEQGFRASADAIPGVTMKRMFVELSAERGKLAAAILEPTNALGTAGTLHGVWISLKGAILENKAYAVLEKAGHGEDLAIEVYRQAQSLILQPELRGIVDRHLAAIQQSHDKMRHSRSDGAVTARSPTVPISQPVSKA
jgi:uncharacterized protein (TIGR02284 family)